MGLAEGDQVGREPVDRRALLLPRAGLVAGAQPVVDRVQLVGERGRQGTRQHAAVGQLLGPLDQGIGPEVVAAHHQPVERGQPGDRDLRQVGHHAGGGRQPGPEGQRPHRRGGGDRAPGADEPDAGALLVSRHRRQSVPQLNLATPATCSMPPSRWERNSGSW